jgi:hypothetical protein
MRKSPPATFEKNVFINCPFDKQYKVLLQPLLFTILYLKLNPRIATERLDSGEQRIDKICELLSESKFSIHDISRLKSAAADEYYRLNMALELGVDYGCRKFALGRSKRKKFLILERDRYNFIIAVSDLGGVDIRSHSNKPTLLVKAVRDWFASQMHTERIASDERIWNDYCMFTG